MVRDTASAKAFANKLLAAPRVAIGYNSISNAIAYSADLIRNSGYTSPRKIIDVSGDGSQRNGQPLEKVRARTVADGITINALVVDAEGEWFPDLSRDALLEHFQRDVIGGGNAFAMVVNGKKRFADAVLNKMIREIALSTP